MRLDTPARIVLATPLLLVAATTPAAAADESQPTWNHKATRQYLDSRAGWWLDWSSADRGQGTTCTSCHTTLPYALTLPAIAKLPGNTPAPDVAQRLLAGVRKRVEGWDALASADPHKGDDALAPIFGGARRDVSLDTECVLNALVLVANDAPGKARLSDAATKSLDIMWARQQSDGAWRWLEFGLRPWEKDGDYFGATLAAVAAGTAGTRYQATDLAPKMTALRGFLTSRLAERPLLHNHALALWAASYSKDLFSEDKKKSLITELSAVQGSDGGWSLRDLGKVDTRSASTGWNIVGAYPQGAVSDGYATGLVVFALKKAGVPSEDTRLKKGIAWLSTHQAADGTWPAVWVNKERDPQGNVGKFNRDAGAAFALLALLEAQQ
jgi:squalene-hopene/tetraprenyl-beta-curcumene cyclase